jgi:ComF family protein
MILPQAVATAGSWLTRLATGALDLALPPHCLTCDTVVEAPGRLCAVCFRKTAFITEPCCDRCGMPFRRFSRGTIRICAACVADPPPWTRARAALRYDDQARRLLLPLKYADRVEIAPALARHMVRAGRPVLGSADLLVPVPLHRRRLLARRYNQSALLARRIGQLAGCAVCVDALRRTTPTSPLIAKSREEREAAVRDAFVVNPVRAKLLAGRRIVLVDDVLTTGATARACTGVLLAAGVARVDLLVAARAGQAGDLF